VSANTGTRITYRDAVRAAIRDALQRDERVCLMGEMWVATAAATR
jgi:pyruvate/2-oxoglutarate/acetoin dehydrogenase E1 component